MKSFKSFLSIVMMALVIQVLANPVVHAADNTSEVSVRKVIRTETFLDAEYPVVYGLKSKSAQEKINGDIDTYIQKINKDTEKSKKKSKLRYFVHRNSNNVLSMTLDVQGVSPVTYGLNYDVSSGKKITLDKYWTKDEVVKRAQDGLSYVYALEVDASKLVTDNFYIDIDENIITLYPTGQVAAVAEGVMEVNLTAAEPEKEEAPVVAVAPQIQKISVKSIITGREVRMRSEASKHSDVIDWFEYGEEVTVTGKATGDGLVWYYVTRADGRTGWVAADFCKPVDNKK